jgi:cysteinyl-tRNA synthetase
MGVRARARVPALACAALLIGAPARAGDGGATAPTAPPAGPGRGFPETGPWLSFYGTARQMGSLERVAARFRIINIDADPSVENFDAAQIARLKAGGRNRVISYLNVGACEKFRDYFRRAPAGFVPCGANRKAQRGRYAGYPDEVWMDPADPDHQRLIVDHAAARLVAAGVDGFFLDNLEILEHTGCDARCQQGGLALVARLRAAFPQHLIVMQNATSGVTRQGRVAQGPFPTLLDGVSREDMYTPGESDGPAAEADLLAWLELRLRPGGRSFFVGTEDYVVSCKAAALARKIYDRSRRRGFSPYVTDASAGQKVICHWAF